MVNKKHRLLSFVIVLLMLVMSVSAGIIATISVSAATGDTVYCQNDENWADVYCYMWNGNGEQKNADWPGVKMTKGEDNLWSYTLTGDWSNIIFNNNSGSQTADLTHQGNGWCYNNKTKNWSEIEDAPDNTTPQVTNPTQPVTPPVTAPAGDKKVIYCLNQAGWSNVNVYMWTTGSSDEHKSWPGETATDIGDGVWMLEYEGDYAKVIFSNNGSNQTSDLTHPGSGQIYNNETGEWSLYDTSKLHIRNFTADPATPQYTGVEINLSMTAGGGEGDLTYKFSVKNGSVTTVVSDYSPDNTAQWTPATAGTYTVIFSVMDSDGNTEEKTMSYTVKDTASETKPVLQAVSVTPTNSECNEILKGKEATVDITAGGGNTGTKLLFYKVKITDPSGKTANVPYYTMDKQYKFTPATLGTYEIEVSVQGSDNSSVTRVYEYECVSELSAPGALKGTVSVQGKQEVGSVVTISATASGGTAPYTYQFSVNGQIVKAYSSIGSYELALTASGSYAIKVSVKDAEGTVADKSTTITITDEIEDNTTSTDSGSEDNPTNPTLPTYPTVVPGEYLKGDANLDGKVNIKDATAIQKHLAELELLSEQGAENGEVDSSDNLTIKDATLIQKYIAGMDIDW